jgi:hypothetical protein
LVVAVAERTDALAMLIRAGQVASDQRPMTDTERPRRCRPPTPAQPETPAGDEYLDAICKEILRLRPVVFDVGRVALVEDADRPSGGAAPRRVGDHHRPG